MMPNLSIMSNMMLRKARRARNQVIKLSHMERNQILRERNASDVVRHSPRIIWITEKPRMLCADLAIRFDITRNVVRSQGTFQDKALKR